MSTVEMVFTTRHFLQIESSTSVLVIYTRIKTERNQSTIAYTASYTFHQIQQRMEKRVCYWKVIHKRTRIKRNTFLQLSQEFAINFFQNMAEVSHDDGGSMFSRNVGNIAYLHTQKQDQH